MSESIFPDITFSKVPRYFTSDFAFLSTGKASLSGYGRPRHPRSGPMPFLCEFPVASSCVSVNGICDSSSRLPEPMGFHLWVLFWYTLPPFHSRKYASVDALLRSCTSNCLFHTWYKPSQAILAESHRSPVVRIISVPFSFRGPEDFFCFYLFFYLTS